MFDSADFELLKAVQYCDNSNCSSYSLIGTGNIRIHSRQKGQVYCSVCKNRWVITKGTIQFGLKTPIEKVIRTLLMLAQGASLRKTCRRQEITTETTKLWIEKAAESVEELTNYMQSDMDLTHNQINDFWDFVERKRKNKHIS